MKRIQTQGGLIQWIILIIILILILSYFGFDLRSLINDGQTQDNFSVVGEWLSKIWNDYLKTPALFIWDELIIPFVWEPIQDLQDRMFLHNNQPDTPG